MVKVLVSKPRAISHQGDMVDQVASRPQHLTQDPEVSRARSTGLSLLSAPAIMPTMTSAPAMAVARLLVFMTLPRM
ncbi:hypothetical protein [Nonomuraea sp. NPDC049709]|uniref:hypothetical protein n=1 Tax=Nonomuraea sp. NPDC049709 TaxID=3154736 RepID=UPI00341C3FEB